MKKIFREYIEFAAQYKTVGDYLQLHAVYLNWIQLYSVDIIAPVVAIFALLSYGVWKISFILIFKNFVVSSKKKAD